MEISIFCFRCEKYEDCKHVNDMQDNKPICLVNRKCGKCKFSERIDGKNEMIGCKKLEVLKNRESVCNWNGN